MTQYIDKAIVLTEIENRIKKYTLLQQKSEMSYLQEELQNKIDCLNSIKGYILNTIGVKEVDLDYDLNYIKDELDRVVKIYKPDGNFGWGTLYNIATHFFELGLKTQKEISMSDKEKTIAYIDKLLEKYPKNYYLLTVAEFIDSL